MEKDSASGAVIDRDNLKRIKDIIRTTSDRRLADLACSDDSITYHEDTIWILNYDHKHEHSAVLGVLLYISEFSDELNLEEYDKAIKAVRRCFEGGDARRLSKFLTKTYGDTSKLAVKCFKNIFERTEGITDTIAIETMAQIIYDGAPIQTVYLAIYLMRSDPCLFNVPRFCAKHKIYSSLVADVAATIPKYCSKGARQTIDALPRSVFLVLKQWAVCELKTTGWERRDALHAIESAIYAEDDRTMDTKYAAAEALADIYGDHSISKSAIGSSRGAESLAEGIGALIEAIVESSRSEPSVPDPVMRVYTTVKIFCRLSEYFSRGGGGGGSGAAANLMIMQKLYRALPPESALALLRSHGQEPSCREMLGTAFTILGENDPKCGAVFNGKMVILRDAVVKAGDMGMGPVFSMMWLLWGSKTYHNWFETFGRLAINHNSRLCANYIEPETSSSTVPLVMAEDIVDASADDIGQKDLYQSPIELPELCPTVDTVVYPELVDAFLRILRINGKPSSLSSSSPPLSTSLYSTAEALCGLASLCFCNIYYARLIVESPEVDGLTAIEAIASALNHAAQTITPQILSKELRCLYGVIASILIVARWNSGCSIKLRERDCLSVKRMTLNILQPIFVTLARIDHSDAPLASHIASLNEEYGRSMMPGWTITAENKSVAAARILSLITAENDSVVAASMLALCAAEMCGGKFDSRIMRMASLFIESHGSMWIGATKIADLLLHRCICASPRLCFPPEIFSTKSFNFGLLVEGIDNNNVYYHYEAALPIFAAFRRKSAFGTCDTHVGWCYHKHALLSAIREVRSEKTNPERIAESISVATWAIRAHKNLTDFLVENTWGELPSLLPFNERIARFFEKRTVVESAAADVLVVRAAVKLFEELRLDPLSAVAEAVNKKAREVVAQTYDTKTPLRDALVDVIAVTGNGDQSFKKAASETFIDEIGRLKRGYANTKRLESVALHGRIATGVDVAEASHFADAPHAVAVSLVRDVVLSWPDRTSTESRCRLIEKFALTNSVCAAATIERGGISAIVGVAADFPELSAVAAHILINISEAAPQDMKQKVLEAVRSLKRI